MSHRVPVTVETSHDPLSRMRVYQLRSSLPVLGEAKVKDRRDRLEEMRRLLLAIIPRERGKSMK